MLRLSDSSEFNSSELPTNPGVYLFRDQNDKILYIGKANNLRSRIRSYFSDSDQPIKTRRLVSKIRSLSWIIVNNESEALLLENRLIKKHAPKYNINLKDAKTFAYIALTRETFPRLFITRKVSPKLEAFGPYTDGVTRRALQKLVGKVFKLRVCKTLPNRACLNAHIELCTSPCTGKVSEKEYQKQVEQARIFLNGNYEQTLERLTSLMQDASRKQNYEYALELQRQIASITPLTEKQIVDTKWRFDQDVMVFRRLGEKMLVVQMSVRKGVLLGKKEFAVEVQPQIEQEFLKAYYSDHPIPHEILLNRRCWGDKAEKTALELFLSSKRGASVKLAVPRRGNKRALVGLAEKNLEASVTDGDVLADLQTALDLPVLPRIIECFDVSNLGPDHVVAGMVRFADGKPDKSNYRRFKIKSVAGQDDLAAMHEVVTRRYKRLLNENALMPEMVMVDGGAGQVAAASSALKALGLQLPLIGLAKEKEEIYLLEEKAPRRFDANSRMMLLLRQIRNAAHNFAVRYYRKRRQMKLRNEFIEK